MSPDFFFRLVGMVVFAIVGYRIGEFVSEPAQKPAEYAALYSLALVGALLGLAFTPYVTTRPFGWIRLQIRQLAATTVLAGTIGLIVGLLISVLLALPLSLVPGDLGKWLPLAVAVFLGYLGISIMIYRQQDMMQAIWAWLPLGGSEGGRTGGGSHFGPQLILDTSAIIDGRIADICQTGFIQGTLVLPGFVLDELRHIADSAEALRRNRGRRGLEIINRLQKDAAVPLTISDVDFEDTVEVDAKLVRLARLLRAPIITNDFNLNRVAQVQGVRALNINELTNAVKSVVLAGEEMEVRIIQEGKEASQGVGFLDDGTMVVVENGRRLIGQEAGVVVTRVLQTVAGRMIFAQLKPE